jgi:hypothetical protein
LLRANGSVGEGAAFRHDDPQAGAQDAVLHAAAMTACFTRCVPHAARQRCGCQPYNHSSAS